MSESKVLGLIAADAIAHLRYGVDAMVEQLPADCHHNISETRTHISDIMAQAKTTPQVIENAKTGERHFVISEDLLDEIIKAFGDPVALFMAKIASRGRAVGRPKRISTFGPARRVKVSAPARKMSEPA